MGIKDYFNFQNSSANVPAHLDQIIINKVQAQSRIDWLMVLTKVSLIYLMGGLVTLSFCPQFGLNPFKASIHATHLFLSYGQWACGLYCGAIFMSAGSLLSLILLNKKDACLINAQLLWKSLAFCSFFVLLLMILGPLKNDLSILSFSIFSLFWFLGAWPVCSIGPKLSLWKYSMLR